MKLARGTRLGPYEIVAPIGAGGMGEVYRARDTRLDRSVAIKVLPAELSENIQLRLRFEREAKTISALSHPHICTLHDVGHEDGVDFLVMEYLEGETLSEKLRKGPLPVAQVLRYGIEIAEALDKAHRQRIVHRDLKPSNIMITKSGLKLLDFGLAKTTVGKSIWDTAKSKLSQQPTAQKPLTAEGSLVGTLEYMAPEQLEGREPDARTDIFALGNVLYRMATGKKPFEGNSDANLIAAILQREPEPITSLQPMTPPSLDRLVRSCLAKSPEERIQTAHDVMLQLTWIAEGSSDPARAVVAVAPARPWRWLVGSSAILMLAILTVFVVLKLKPQAPPPKIRYLTMTLPSNAPLTPLSGSEVFAVSSDGKRFVYVAESPAGKQLYLREIDKPKAEPLPNTEGAESPFFSPDGRWIGFKGADNTLKKVSLEGGSPVTICNVPRIRGATWGPDDTIVFGLAFKEPLQRVSASGGTPEPLFKTTKNVRWPIFLPGGKHLLYTVAPDFTGNYDQAEIAVLSLETGRSQTVVKGGIYARYASGHLLYFHSEALFAVPFDLGTMRAGAPAKPILEEVSIFNMAGLVFYDVSADGTIFYLPLDPAMDQRDLVWVERSGKTTPLGTGRRYVAGQLSPDQQWILVSIQDRSRRADLWLYEIARDSWTRVTTEANNASGFWSPDGERFVFSSNRNGPYNVFLMPGDLTTPPKQLTNRQEWTWTQGWSPDGKLISVTEQTLNTGGNIWFVSWDPIVEMKPFLATPANESGAVFSPDGRWVAYQSDASGQPEVYVVSADGRGRKWMISNEGGSNPLWNPAGRELFYWKGDELMSVDVKTSPNFEASKPRVLFEGPFNSYDVSRDGKRFLMVQRNPQMPRTQINMVEGLLSHVED